MGANTSPTQSECQTEHEALSHDQWFRAKVQASRDDARPSIPHTEAMTAIRKKLSTKLAQQSTTPTQARDRGA